MEERSPRSPAAFAPRLTHISAPLLVCFSHLRWDFVWQRPQHLLSRAAKHYRVLLIEEPLFEKSSRPRMDVSQRPGGITVAVPILPERLSPHAIVEAQRKLVERLLAREPEGQRILWYYTPMAMAFTGHLDCDLCIYDNMDELSLFRGASEELVDYESELFRRADLVFTGGMSLYEAKRNRHRNVHGFPSSIDFEHFAKARGMRDEPGPADQAYVPHPRLGFFGVIDERMDIDLVGAVSDLRPDWRLFMIGPVVKIDPAILPRRDNIHWLGAKSYAELPRYLSGWDAGLMPFALNESTKFISPTKTPEFLAAGVPVVSTPISDVVRPYGENGLVEIAKTPLEVIRKAEALLERPRQPWLSRVDRHLAAGSWNKTWSAMHKLMLDSMAEAERRTDLCPIAIAPAE
jgi:glycosyltransferase involved in cell wall biosynthesis